jgi:two-component system, NarL family, response regulator NreC
MRRTTVLIADDHAIVTEGLAGLLKRHDFDVVGEVGDGHKLIAAAKQLRPDVIVTDLSMPGLTGLEVLARLKAEQVDSKVVVLTMHRNASVATVAMRYGASAFLLKESAGDELLTAIREVLKGRVYLTPALTRDVTERMAGRSTAADPQLTARQRDV